MIRILKTGLVICFIAIIAGSCYKENNYDPTKLSQQDSANIKVWGGGMAIAADSFSLIKIAVVFPYDADSSKCSVSLVTDLGIFVESGSASISLTAKNNLDSAKKVAFATLRSGTITGIAHIQCTLYSFSKTIIDTFYNSYPDSINLSASTLKVLPQNGPTGEVTFTAKIYKTPGSPSQKNAVTLMVTDTNQQAIGSFRVKNFLTDNSGNSQFVYVLGDSVANNRPQQYYGKLFATAVDTNASRKAVRSTIQLISSSQ